MRKLVVQITLFLILIPQAMAGKSFETLGWQTKNGARVVFYQAMEVPMLDISVAFAAGSAHDGKNFGLSALTTRLLNQGSQGMDANTIAEQLADTGAQFEGESSRDMVVLNLKTLTKHDALERASDTFSSIINHPDFPVSAFNLEKKQQLMAIAEGLESPDEVANQAFFQTLYQDHPYGHPILGNQNSVTGLTLDQVRHFYQQYFVSENAVIVLVGAIDKTTAQQLAEKVTEALPKGHPAAITPKAKPLTQEINVESPFPSSQTVLRLGQLGIDHHDRHYFPLQVGSYILGGGGLVSRLAHELREARGLTYGVYSQFSPMPGIGPFLISLSTQNSQTQTALDVTRETLSSFVKNGPNEEELIAAKQYLTGSFPLSLASNRSIADMLLKISFYHLPEDYLQTYVDHINAVKMEEIKAAFQQRISPDKLLEVAVGKA